MKMLHCLKKTVATPNCLDAVAERLREEAVDDPDEQGQADEEEGGERDDGHQNKTEED